MAYRLVATKVERFFLEIRKVGDEALLKTAFHDSVVVFAENVAGAVDEFVDEHGTQEGDTFVGVAHLLVGFFLVDKELLVFVGVEERQEAVLDGFGADDTALVGVFHVKDEVADVVGRLHHVRERMAGVHQVLLVKSGDAALFNHFFERLNLRVEDVVFLTVAFVE